MKNRWIFVIFFFLPLAACSPEAATLPEAKDPAIPSISLSSPVFSEGDAIPRLYSCDGEDFSPTLEWAAPPAGTQSFALIMDDPDAPSGDWVHWVLYNIPAGSRSLPEKIPSDAVLTDDSQHGKNSWKAYGYGGPCPPRGTHRYFFKLYALDMVLDADPGLRKQELLDALQGHILASGQLMGTFTR